MPSYRTVYGSDWLRHSDIGPNLGDEAVWTLGEMGESTFNDGKKQVTASIPKMDGRRLGINVTNCETIEDLAGTEEYMDWGGTDITVFVTTCKDQHQKTVRCIRIRPTSPTPQSSPPPATTDNGQPATAQVLGTVAAERLMNKINELAATNPLASIASLRLYLEAHYPQHRDHMAKYAPEDWPAEVVGTIKTWLDNPTVTTKVAKGELDDDEIPF